VLSWQCNDGHLIQCALEGVEQPAGQPTPAAHIYPCTQQYYGVFSLHAAACLICSTWHIDLNSLLKCFMCSILAAVNWGLVAGHEMVAGHKICSMHTQDTSDCPAAEGT
jgi:hypothetical protein